MKKHVLAKDKKKRNLYKKYELKKKILKSIVLNRNVYIEKKNKVQELVNKIPKNASITRIRNRCIVTGRGRGVYSFFKLSRLSFRELASFGFLPGIRKASW